MTKTWVQIQADGKLTEEVLRLLDFWKKTLDLKHWDIRVQVCSAESDLFKNKSRQGHAEIVPSNLTAMISILNPLDYHEMRCHWPQDIEDTIVHELVHVVWESSFSKKMSQAEWLHMEQSVCLTARALLRLHREL